MPISDEKFLTSSSLEFIDYRCVALALITIKVC